MNTANKPNIAILGYGRMGKAIEASAQRKQLIVSDIFDIDSQIKANGEYQFDVAIDFSSPDAVLDNAKIVAEMGKNLVIGTTGWYTKLSELEAIIKGNNTACVYASNFSIGMNIFFKVVNHASQLLNNYDDFDLMISETHHKNKIDHPSGTALSLGEIILSNIERKKQIVSELPAGEAIKPEELNISYSRLGAVMGTHSVVIDSEVDSITLTHNAKSRVGFADGAVFAANWIHGKQGLYNFADIV